MDISDKQSYGTEYCHGRDQHQSWIEQFLHKIISTFLILNVGTNYMLSVRTMCNDTLYSDWVDFAFRTVPAPPALPYVVGFEDEAENENWTLVNGDQMNKLVIGSDEEAVLSGNKSLYVSHDGSDYFYYFNYGRLYLN